MWQSAAPSCVGKWKETCVRLWSGGYAKIQHADRTDTNHWLGHTGVNETVVSQLPGIVRTCAIYRSIPIQHERILLSHRDGDGIAIVEEPYGNVCLRWRERAIAQLPQGIVTPYVDGAVTRYCCAVDVLKKHLSRWPGRRPE